MRGGLVSDWAEILRKGLAGGSPPLSIIYRRWLPTDDDIYGSLYGPQALAHKIFGRLNPHWYLDGSDE